MFITSSAEIFGPWQQLWHSLASSSHSARLLRVYNHPTDAVGSSPLLRFPPIDALGMCSVCHIYTLAYFLQGAAVRSREFFLCKVGMKRLCGKGTFLLSQKFFRKRCSFLCTFSKPVKGENFLRYPLSSKPHDFMPLIARKNQGSTPMPLLK